MDGYAAGSVKHHPDGGRVAIRTIFEDNDSTGCLSWLEVTSGGVTNYRTEGFVADWPDAEGLTLKVGATPVS